MVQQILTTKIPNCSPFYLANPFKSHQLNNKPTRSINFLNIILTIMQERFAIQFDYFDQEVFDNIRAINSIKSKIRDKIKKETNYKNLVQSAFDLSQLQRFY